MKVRSDFLVIGSGLAGLSFALKAAKHGTVVVLAKTKLDETNTSYAQGGIAAVINDKDSYEKHIQDTLICGDGLCNEKVVRMVVEEAPNQIKQLEEWDVHFDRIASGEYDLAKEGGHSEHRVLHYKDTTGAEIQRVLCEHVRSHKNIKVFENFYAIDLITQHHLGKEVERGDADIECYGAYAMDLNNHDIVTFLSKTTLVATGGVGNLYHITTNPPIATGDGIAMVFRAKGEIENLEFVQFHPTALYSIGERPNFLITEALRGFGAILKTQDGSSFMHKYDERGSLAPRDIVARAIDNEMKTSGDEHVFLDATHLDAEQLLFHFPNIYKKCLQHDIDITKDMIPVVPAAHYMCGGIKVDMDARTSISRLYAAGETASTGLHGANRLASNSLIEAIVYADKAAKHAVEHVKEYTLIENIPDWNDEGTTHTEEMILITQNYKEVQQIFSYYVGIVRSNLRLQRAWDRLDIIYQETEELFKKSKLSQKLCELRNMINTGYLLIRMAQERKESRGLHYTIDYPKKK